MLRRGLCSVDMLINVALCCLGYVPGLIHAWYIIAHYPPTRYGECGEYDQEGQYYVVTRSPNRRHRDGRDRRDRRDGRDGRGGNGQSNNNQPISTPYNSYLDSYRNVIVTSPSGMSMPSDITRQTHEANQKVNNKNISENSQNRRLLDNQQSQYGSIAESSSRQNGQSGSRYDESTKSDPNLPDSGPPSYDQALRESNY